MSFGSYHSKHPSSKQHLSLGSWVMESKQVLFRGPHQFWKMSYENRMISLKTLIIQTSPKTTPNTFPEHRFETRNCQARKLHSLKFKKNLWGPWPPWAITWLHHWCSGVLPSKLVSYTRLGLTVFSTASIFFLNCSARWRTVFFSIVTWRRVLLLGSVILSKKLESPVEAARYTTGFIAYCLPFPSIVGYQSVRKQKITKNCWILRCRLWINLSRYLELNCLSLSLSLSYLIYLTLYNSLSKVLIKWKKSWTEGLILIYARE